MPLLMHNKKLGFKAIAVETGIDIRGKNFAIKMQTSSVAYE
jgi:hypothetical protein